MLQGDLARHGLDGGRREEVRHRQLHPKLLPHRVDQLARLQTTVTVGGSGETGVVGTEQ